MFLLLGSITLILGLVSGFLLLIAPLGVLPFSPGLLTWLLFPAFTLLGYLLLSLGSRTGEALVAARLGGGALLILALGGLIGLFALAIGILPGSTGFLSFTLLAVFGLFLGGLLWYLGRHLPADAAGR